jgi:ribonucleoside-diphosphate reductase alpha chain
LYHKNLYSYVESPFSKTAKFNWNKFKKDVRLSVRIMDNVLELEREKINTLINHIEASYEDEVVKKTELNLWKKVLDKLERGRRMGIGILGQADSLAALNLTYATKEANNFAIEVQKVLAVESYSESILLAEERGAFPIWNQELEHENPYLKRVIIDQISQEYPDIYKMYSKTGRRNIAMLTIAPTGTIAMFGNRVGVSSGMEPVFEIVYRRRKKVGDLSTKVDFVDKVGDKWEEYLVVHPIFKEWYSSFTEDRNAKELRRMSFEEIQALVQKSPYCEATANEVSVLSKIELQGEIQKWVDHSISITHNLPQGTTEEQVAEYYMEAWKAGCKGCTVYRDGSREGVLIREDSKKSSNFEPHKVVERPKVLHCELHKLQALGEGWFVVVGLLDQKPYEIFAVKEDKFPAFLKSTSAKEVLTGELLRRGSRVYDLIVRRPDTQEPFLIEDLVSLLESLSDRSDTRRFSLELRYGIPPLPIIETIEKQQKPITSFEKAICRVLKKYIKEGEVSGLRCEQCGSKKVHYEGGCPKCEDCGFQKCG